MLRGGDRYLWQTSRGSSDGVFCDSDSRRRCPTPPALMDRHSVRMVEAREYSRNACMPWQCLHGPRASHELTRRGPLQVLLAMIYYKPCYITWIYGWITGCVAFLTSVFNIFMYDERLANISCDIPSIFFYLMLYFSFHLQYNMLYNVVYNILCRCLSRLYVVVIYIICTLLLCVT